MRKILFCVLAVAVATLLNSCHQQNPNECRIHGTMGSDQYEGKLIFLVPLNGPATMETVDSVEIKDKKFEFVTQKMQMYKILLDYHYRLGIQPLLVVGEAGDVQVVIDSISHSTGTPQNDSLELWKQRTEQHALDLGNLKRMIASMKENAPLLNDHVQHGGKDDFYDKEAENIKEGMYDKFSKLLTDAILKDNYQRHGRDHRLRYQSRLPVDLP